MVLDAYEDARVRLDQKQERDNPKPPRRGRLRA